MAARRRDTPRAAPQGGHSVTAVVCTAFDALAVILVGARGDVARLPLTGE